MVGRSRLKSMQESLLIRIQMSNALFSNPKLAGEHLLMTISSIATMRLLSRLWGRVPMWIYTAESDQW